MSCRLRAAAGAGAAAWRRQCQTCKECVDCGLLQCPVWDAHAAAAAWRWWGLLLLLQLTHTLLGLALHPKLLLLLLLLLQESVRSFLLLQVSVLLW